MSKNTESTPAFVTGFAAAKLANVTIVASGFRAIPPQMVYNYTTARVRAGKAPMIAMNEDGLVSVEDTQRWVTAYVAKKQAKLDAAQAETVAAE